MPEVLSAQNCSLQSSLVEEGSVSDELGDRRGLVVGENVLHLAGTLEPDYDSLPGHSAALLGLQAGTPGP